MATLTRTFSVKNGIDVANTVIVDSSRNLSNVVNATITGLVYTTPNLAGNTSSDSALRIQPNTQPSTPIHRNIFRVSSYYNAGVNGHDFIIKTDETNKFYLTSDWGNDLRLGCISGGGSVANVVPTAYLSLSTTTAAFVGLPLTVSGNLTVDTNTLHVDSVANRVGINRTDPGASLDVTSSAAFAARITGPANVYQDLTDGTGTARLQLLSNAPILTSIGSHALMFGTNNTERVRIDPTGNVGIGTTAPVEKLSVNQGNFYAIRSGGAKLRLLDENNEVAVESLPVGAGSEMVLKTNATEKVRITGSGNVGIGTTAPLAKFTANGTVWLNQVADYSGSSSKIQMSAGSNVDNIMIRTNSLYLYNYGNTGETLLRFGNGFETWQIGTSAGATPDFRLYELNGTSTRIMVKAGGNVGIGTTAPGYKLEVAGAFAAQTKSFIITHPTKPDMKLRYGSLEGPENGVYVRGRSKNGIIRLPDYWTGLVDESTITVNLTPIGSHQKLFVEEIVDNTIIVGGGWFDSLDFFYTVFAERKDVDKLIVEI